MLFCVSVKKCEIPLAEDDLMTMNGLGWDSGGVGWWFIVTEQQLLLKEEL